MTTKTASPPGSVRRAHDPQAGFNLIEVLAGMAILMLIAFFMLPLFSRSALNNLSGRESTQVSKFTRDSQELYSRAEFGSADLTIDAGDEKRFDDAWVSSAFDASKPWLRPLQSAGEWTRVDGALPAGSRWRRTTTVRQHSIADLYDDPPNAQALDAPLPVGTADVFIHLKWIEVEVEGVRGEGGLLGPNQRLVVSQLKAF